jgi:steroid delta-isomerase-like uncharacterized protein
VARAFVDCVNAGDWDRLRSLFSDDVAEVQVAIQVHTRGADALMESYQAAMKPFPDGKHIMTHIHGDDTNVTMEATFTGTHTGPFDLGNGQVIAPTNRTMSLECCDVFRVENGKIVEARVYWDLASILAQIGAASVPVVES